VNGEGLDTVRALICEDEPLARRAIRDYLSDVEWIEIVGEAENGPEALRSIHKLEPDLVFLDVRMPGMSGVEVLDAATVQTAVVFTTAHDEFAVSAFEHGAVDYLIKPFGRERLLRTLDRVRVRLRGEARDETGGAPSAPYAERIFGRHRGAMVPVAVRELRHIEAVDGGVRLHLAGANARTEVTLDVTLAEIASRLDPRDFVRIHRGHVVHLAFVRGVRRYDERRLSVTLDDGSVLVASRGGSQVLREHMR
jgi:two-component system LytT family response regulator